MEVYKIMRRIDRINAQNLFPMLGNQEREDVGL